jgi:hypothetical protein
VYFFSTFFYKKKAGRTRPDVYARSMQAACPSRRAARFCFIFFPYQPFYALSVNVPFRKK